jgi:hypothetical protein
MAKPKLTREICKIVEEAAEEVRNPDSDCFEMDAAKCVHKLMSKVSEQQVKEWNPAPSEEDLKEGACGKMLNAYIGATRTRPAYKCTLLRDLPSMDYVPDEWVSLPNKKIKQRKDLYASEARLIAKSENDAAKTQLLNSAFANALAVPFTKYEAVKLAEKRAASELTLHTFLQEEGYISEPDARDDKDVAGDRDAASPL